MMKKIKGISVVSYRSGFMNGNLETIGYLGDLRIEFSKKLIRE